jgi:hypothetical protein
LHRFCTNFNHQQLVLLAPTSVTSGTCSTVECLWGMVQVQSSSTATRPSCLLLLLLLLL